MFPYMEQTAMYETLSTAGGGNIGGLHVTIAWWNSQSADFQKQYGSLSMYRCPTRRSGGSRLTSVSDSTAFNGPVADYAFPVLIMNASQWWQYHTATDVSVSYNNPNNYYGPIRIAKFAQGDNGAPSDKTTWAPRDGISWWLDGTSNQIVAGEKHVPKNRLEQCSSTDAYRGDCTYIIPSLSDSLARGWRLTTTPRRLARGPNDYTSDTDNPPHIYAFGSWHTGICNFLLGDGSVRALSVTTPADTILERLMHVNDGQPVT
ncbi:MAG: DUF1559 domain-containing protein, partial [Planctomycetaceae bacterium]|nr:DUF1559 domain-containing protein [Planctomycetaceae bacterium]